MDMMLKDDIRAMNIVYKFAYSLDGVSRSDISTKKGMQGEIVGGILIITQTLPSCLESDSSGGAFSCIHLLETSSAA